MENELVNLCRLWG